MVRPVFLDVAGHTGSQPVFAIIGLFLLATVLAGLCARHYGRSPRSPMQQHLAKDDAAAVPIPASPRSPLVLPKQLVASISSKAIPHIGLRKKENGGEFVAFTGEEERRNKGGQQLGFGEGGVWQKSILMGDKCRPHQFSGAIYYDSQGNRLPELPRSPRASPLPTYFTTIGKEMDIDHNIH